MRDWKCYVTTTDRNLSRDYRDVTAESEGELRAESAIPGSDSDPGLYANDININSQPSPAGPRLTLVCRFALGLSELEWGGMRKVLDLWCLVWGWQPGCQFWCLTGPCLNMTQSFRLWYSPSPPPCSPHLQIPAQLLCWHATPISVQSQPNNHKPEDD